MTKGSITLMPMNRHDDAPEAEDDQVVDEELRCRHRAWNLTPASAKRDQERYDQRV